MSNSKSTVQQSTLYSSVFFQCRTVAFGAISFFSFLWIIFLCVIVFLHWEAVDRPQQSFMAVMLILHTLTILIFIFLIVKEFRPWLDAARCFLGLIAHIGIAGAYSHWTPSFQCRQAGADSGACFTRIVFTIVSSWVIPVLLVVYTVCLGVMMYRLKRAAKSEAFDYADLEKRTTRSLDLKVDWPAPPPSSFPETKTISRPMTLNVIPSPVTYRHPIVHTAPGRQSLSATIQYAPSPMTMDPRGSVSTYHSRHHSQPRQPSYSGVPEHLASTWSRHHSMQPHSRRPSYPSATPMPYPYLAQTPIKPAPEPMPKRKPPPLTLDASTHAAIQERNLHYSALFQQAPRTPVTATPVVTDHAEPVPPLPTPWGPLASTKHQSQQYSPGSQYSQTSLEYLKDSPIPSPQRLSKPSPASKRPSL